MAKQLVVKALLQYSEGLELGSNPEVRRFKIPTQGGAADGDLYRRLVDTLTTTFPEIKGQEYSLYWKDNDGDMVQFSTVEELQAAVAVMRDNVFRLYVVVDTDDTEGEEAEGEGDASKMAKLRKQRRRFRRKVRMRRRSALADAEVPKEYRQGARIIIREIHESKKAGEDGGERSSMSEEDKAIVASLQPEVRDFIQRMNSEWYTKLATQRPSVAARRMRMAERTLPASVNKDSFLWLIRFMSRWRRRHAGMCDVNSSGASSEDDANDDEEVLLKRHKKKRAARRKKDQGAKELESDDTADRNVSKEFRKGVRVLMKLIHRLGSGDKGDKPANSQEQASLAALSPEIQEFLRGLVNDWQTQLTQKHPRRVAKRIRKRRKNLPAGMLREHYLWVCRYFRRWFNRNAASCEAMAGWPSEEEGDISSDEDSASAQGGKQGKQEDSDSDDGKKEKREVPPEFVKAVRVLVNKKHKRGKTEAAQADVIKFDQQAALAAVPSQVQAFIQAMIDEWDAEVSQKRPRVVARMMRKKTRELPAGVGESHVKFLCRFLTRWYKKNAARCISMAAWSSGETGDETD